MKEKKIQTPPDSTGTNVSGVDQGMNEIVEKSTSVEGLLAELATLMREQITVSRELADKLPELVKKGIELFEKARNDKRGSRLT